MVEHGNNRSDLAPGLLSKRDPEAFRDTVHGVRLVCDFGTSKIIGIATWEPRHLVMENHTPRNIG